MLSSHKAELRFSKLFERQPDPSYYHHALWIHAVWKNDMWEIDPISIHVTRMTPNDLSWIYDCYLHFSRDLPRVHLPEKNTINLQ